MGREIAETHGQTLAQPAISQDFCVSALKKITSAFRLVPHEQRRVSQRNRLSSGTWAIVSHVPSFRNGGKLCHWQQLKEGIVKNNTKIVSPLALSK